MNIYILIFALCFVGFQYLEEVIRIDYNNQNKFFTYLLGVIPNFLPAIGMPYIFVLIIKELKGKSTNTFFLKKEIHLSNSNFSNWLNFLGVSTDIGTKWDF